MNAAGTSARTAVLALATVSIVGGWLATGLEQLPAETVTVSSAAGSPIETVSSQDDQGWTANSQIVRPGSGGSLDIPELPQITVPRQALGVGYFRLHCGQGIVCGTLGLVASADGTIFGISAYHIVWCCGYGAGLVHVWVACPDTLGWDITQGRLLVGQPRRDLVCIKLRCPGNAQPLQMYEEDASKKGKELVGLEVEVVCCYSRGCSVDVEKSRLPDVVILRRRIEDVREYKFNGMDCGEFIVLDETCDINGLSGSVVLLRTRNGRKLVGIYIGDWVGRTEADGANGIVVPAWRINAILERSQRLEEARKANIRNAPQRRAQATRTIPRSPR